MEPVSVIIPAARLLEPVRQGELDSLCGLYSIINAIQIAAYPVEKLERATLHALYRVGVDTMTRLGVLHRVMGVGIEEPPWTMLATALIDDSDFVAGVPIRRRWLIPEDGRRVRTRELVRVIKRELRKHRPVLAVLWGEYSHSTVIVGYTATRFVLFDSSGHRWVLIRSCGIDHERSDKRHRLSAASAISLSAKRAPH